MKWPTRNAIRATISTGTMELKLLALPALLFLLSAPVALSSCEQHRQQQQQYNRPADASSSGRQQNYGLPGWTQSKWPRLLLGHAFSNGREMC